MSVPAYIYARFSTAEQAKGSSLERQLADGRAFVISSGWDHNPEREIVDEGKSAFHGLNREEGSVLHDFERRAVAGEFTSGAILAVENIDRLTRQGWEHATDLLRTLTSNGVTVCTWQGNETFKANERIDMQLVMALVLKSELAREESAKKSKRLKAAWKKKAEDAASGKRKVMTSIMPGWLEPDPETKQPRVVPHRAAILNQMYDWYLEGKSIPWIARTLNQQGEQNWGRGKHGDKGWSYSTIHKYLTHRTVLGEYIPNYRTPAHRKAPRGAPIIDFYPQVIATEKFDRVQVVRKQRQGWGGKSAFNFPNMFTGIARCGECLGPMHLTAQSKAGQTKREKRKDGSYRVYTEKNSRAYLTCNNARRRYKCTSRAYVRYDALEPALLSKILVLALNGDAPAPDSDFAILKGMVAEQQRRLEVKEAQLGILVCNLMEVHSRTVAQKVSDLESDIEADKTTLEATRKKLLQEAARPAPEKELSVLFGLQEALASDEPETRYEARVRAHQALKSFIDIMECDPNGQTSVIVGGNAIGFAFDRTGDCIDSSILKYANAVFEFDY